MDREQFWELMLTDEIIFAGYAKLFMASKSQKAQGFLDWSWEKYREGIMLGSPCGGLGVFYFDQRPSAVFQEGTRPAG